MLVKEIFRPVCTCFHCKHLYQHMWKSKSCSTLPEKAEAVDSKGLNDKTFSLFKSKKMYRCRFSCRCCISRVIFQQTFLLKIVVLTKACQHSSFTQLELKDVELVEKIFMVSCYCLKWTLQQSSTIVNVTQKLFVNWCSWYLEKILLIWGSISNVNANGISAGTTLLCI